jgi:hypothetical protein
MEERRDDVFVIRIWGEPTKGSQTVRGRIQHIASGRDRYFSNFGDLCDFILALRSSTASGEQQPLTP